MKASRAEAKELGERFYYTGKPCKHGHLSPRYTATRNCVNCHNINSRKWEFKNREKTREMCKKYRESNKHYWKNYAKKTQRVRNARESNRRALKLSATPPWADLEEIRRIYKLCPAGHHVDHMVPLKGKSVCGLHVPWNLQYLPAIENIAKGNRMEDLL